VIPSQKKQCVFSSKKFARHTLKDSKKRKAVWHSEAKFVKILPTRANSSRTLSHRKYFLKHKLKLHYRASFTQNFRSVSIKMKELEQSGTITMKWSEICSIKQMALLIICWRVCCCWGELLLVLEVECGNEI